MLRLVFGLFFGGRWYVQVVLAMAAFAAAVAMFLSVQETEAEKVRALREGPPEAVSLNAFDPERDVHPADEVHVIGWINPAYNYQLTETHRKRSDIVRRMFVLFGPEDTAATRTARAVVLMHEGEVDRFVGELASNFVGQVEGNPLFTLNGTGKGWAILDDMAEDALAEQGLTKAPGFRYIEIWPAAGREAALKPAPEVAFILAGIPAGFGALLLIVGLLRRSRPPRAAQAIKTRKPQPAVPLHAAAQGLPWQKPAPQAAPAARKRKAPAGLLLIGGLIAALAAFPQAGLVLFPLAFFGFAIYGLRTATRKVGDGAVRALDQLTGVATPRQPLAVPAPAPVDAGPVVTTPSLGARATGLLRNRRFTQWLPFLGAITMMVVLGWITAGPQGVADRFAGLLAPLGVEPATMTPTAGPGQMPAAEDAATGFHLAAGAQLRSGLLWLGVTLFLAFALAYARRWLNRRHGLALDDPWERLDRRLH